MFKRKKKQDLDGQRPTGKTQDAKMLSDDILSQLRRINSDCEVVEAVALHRRLEAELKKVRGALAECSAPGPMGSTIRHDGERDAEALLSGTPVEDLRAPVQESERSALLRQFHALERAVPVALATKEQVFYRVCESEMARLTPLRKEIYNDVLMAFEALLSELRHYSNFLDALRRRGHYGMILERWNLTPLENQLLHGGNLNMNLELYIDTRRKAAGIEVEKNR